MLVTVTTLGYKGTDTFWKACYPQECDLQLQDRHIPWSDSAYPSQNVDGERRQLPGAQVVHALDEAQGH